MNNPAFWSNDWMETQQKYWESWTDMSMKAMGLERPRQTPWESAMDQWWKAVSPAAPAAGRDFMERMIDQGKTFFRMADDVSRNLGAGAGSNAWTQALEKTVAHMQQAFGGGLSDGDDAMHKMMAFWEMPFDNWQRMVSSLSLTPGDALRNMPHEQVKEGLHRFLSAPGLGYTREEQGQYQDLMRKGVEYQKALQEYTQFFSGLGLKSVEVLRSKLEQMRAKDQVVDSARGLYDLWVGCCEDVYAEQVMTPEYARIHGRLVNTLMALKQRMAVMVDEALGAMNMPTRRELRTLQDRLQEARRDTKTLRRELDALKEQVAALATGTPAPAPAAPRKPAARKKTAPPSGESA